MKYCAIAFQPKDEPSLLRTQQFFKMLKAAKESCDTESTEAFESYLDDSERQHFWHPTPEEMAQWNKEWNETPVNVRLSPSMPTPPWDFESMLASFWDGEYDLIAISASADHHLMSFDPHAYPFGGTGCMVAMLECFGNKIIGIDDGTGLKPPEPRRTWQSRSSDVRSKKSWQFWRK